MSQFRSIRDLADAPSAQSEGPDNFVLTIDKVPFNAGGLGTPAGQACLQHSARQSSTMVRTTFQALTHHDHGLVGELHYPTDPRGPRAAILVLGGSEGGLTGSAFMAQALAQEGYCALALAYFGAAGLPAELVNIPLEYFEAALRFLRGHPGVAPRRIAALGISKGGEAALLLASRDRSVRTVIAGVPSNVSWQGVNRANFNDPSGSWTFAGKAVPFLPYDLSAPFVSVLDLYERSLLGLAAKPEAEISVERINGPVVLVAGEDDTLWPSASMCRSIEARLKAKGFGYSVETLIYPDAGHGAFGPPVPAGHPYSQLDALGGSLAGNVAARTDSWSRALDVLASGLESDGPM
jgi:dienelactone hydrolase